jgi:hypothetical protein
MSGLRHTSPLQAGRADRAPLSERSLWRTRPRLLVRLRSHLHAPELDQALAAGQDPLSSEQLLWRAQQLTEPHRRLEYAEAIRRIIAEVDQGGPQMLPGPQLVRRDVIAANRALLLVLAERTRAEQPLALRGLAMVELLVGDGRSPLYRGLSPFELRTHLLEILAALDPFGP